MFSFVDPIDCILLDTLIYSLFTIGILVFPTVLTYDPLTSYQATQYFLLILATIAGHSKKYASYYLGSLYNTAAVILTVTVLWLSNKIDRLLLGPNTNHGSTHTSDTPALGWYYLVSCSPTGSVA